MLTSALPQIGISALSVYEPSWSLGNDWFAGRMPRKFAQHTGIEARFIASEDEVTLGWQAARKLQAEYGCNFKNCAALVFVSPSFVPMSAAQQLLGEELAKRERTGRAARHLARRLGVNGSITGINWFCSGYPRALSQVTQRILPKLNLRPDQFVLVITASRISRITDYSCPQTAGLFGDLATATLLARTASRDYPVHFELLHSSAERRSTSAPYFKFHLRENVPTPTHDGGERVEPSRLVFSLDGMGIADAAPRAMAGALESALGATGIAKEEVRFILPHQAGAAIVRLAAMKMEQLGIQGEVINGLTRQVGNVSSSSIPFGLKQRWSQLRGIVACPTAAVGSPDRPEVLQGCLLLRATTLHERNALAAA